ncbi:glycosyltransferase [Saccharolobus sp.]|uniref:glycosyltransferase family 4 protein n=1 Tax=Saccharolobus sp. TaxID=2100761 RepID=UPI00317A3CBB
MLKNLKLILISTAPPYSGRGVYTLNLYNELKQFIKPILIWKYHFHHGIIKQVTLIPIIFTKKLTKENTIIHFLSEGSSIISPILAGKKIVTLHDIPHSKFFYGLLKNSFDAIITVSEDIRVSLKTVCPKTPIYNIPLGVDSRIFKPLSRDYARECLSLGKKDLVLFTSDGDPKKHVDIVLDVLYCLRVRYKLDIKLIILGKPTEIIIQKIRNLGLNNSVIFLYDVPTRILVYAYNSANLMLYLSTYDASPLVVLEAMACGLPVISTKVGSVPFFLKGYEELLIEKFSDVDAITEKVFRFLNDNTALDYYSKSLRERAVREFSWRRVAAETVKVYEKVLQSV